ncbi:MAG: DUF1616 domain-containing protein [Candidatus Bathyarchaeia archaeon]
MKCLKLKPIRWLEIIIAFTALTLLATYLIPSNSLFVVFRYVFGFVFVAFLPGYCLVNILFMNRNKLDFVEELVLSVALSFGLDGLVGLFLGLSPIGINFASITISLSAVVLVFAVVVFIRRVRERPVQTPEQESAKKD